MNEVKVVKSYVDTKGRQRYAVMSMNDWRINSNLFGYEIEGMGLIIEPTPTPDVYLTVSVDADGNDEVCALGLPHAVDAVKAVIAERAVAVARVEELEAGLVVREAPSDDGALVDVIANELRLQSGVAGQGLSFSRRAERIVSLIGVREADPDLALRIRKCADMNQETANKIPGVGFEQLAADLRAAADLVGGTE